MKYIRTKDGRILKYFPPIFPTCDNRIGYPSSAGLIFEKEILKQADTIEELCDGIYAIERNGKLKVPYVGKTTQDLKVIIDLIDKDNYEVYGAIWVKGEHNEPILKSVAKIKGVLPNGEIDWELL